MTGAFLSPEGRQRCTHTGSGGGLCLGAGRAEESQKADRGEQWCLSTDTCVRRAGPEWGGEAGGGGR